MSEQLVKRIQAKKMADILDGTVWVGLGSRWDTPFPVGLSFPAHKAKDLFEDRLKSAIDRIGLISSDKWDRFDWMAHNLSFLRGKNLACSCPTCVACHGNVLLKYANL